MGETSPAEGGKGVMRFDDVLRAAARREVMEDDALLVVGREARGGLEGVARVFTGGGGGRVR